MKTILPSSKTSIPTLGLALSGSGSKLMFYVGFLEVLDRQKIPINYIAAMSGASIVAGAYACGNLEKFKNLSFSLTKAKIMQMLPFGQEGLYSLEKLEDWGRTEITGGKKMEEVKPLLGFLASDINSGKVVVLSMGDIARAARISCTLPFFFEAVQWGDKVLVDGGLLNVIPTDVVRQAGMDIVIGVNMRGTKHLFSENQLAVKKTYNQLKKILLVEYLENAWDAINGQNHNEETSEARPQMLGVLGKSMDLALKTSQNEAAENYDCDLMITPNILDFKLKDIESRRQELYEIGKQCALENIPKILELISSKQ